MRKLVWFTVPFALAALLCVYLLPLLPGLLCALAAFVGMLLVFCFPGKRIKEAEEFLLSRVEDPDIQLQDARQLLNTLAETMLWQKGREDCAMGILQQAQNCECPKSGNVFYQTFYIMAILYRNRAQYSAEIVVLENVLQVREQHPANLCTAHYMTGAAYEKLGNSEEALAHYRTALKFGKRVKYKYDYTKVEKAIERMCK